MNKPHSNSNHLEQPFAYTPLKRSKSPRFQEISSHNSTTASSTHPLNKLSLLSQSTSHTGAHLMQPSSEAYEVEDRCFRVSVARRLMLPHPAVADPADIVQFCPNKSVAGVICNKPLDPKQHHCYGCRYGGGVDRRHAALARALRMPFNHTVVSRYLLNRKYLLSPVLSTDRVNTLGWILSLTSTVRSRIWMCPLLLFSLAVRPWSQQPAQDQDTWPREWRRTNLTGTHTSISFLPLLRPQAGLAHMPGNSSATNCEMLTTTSCQRHLVHHPKCATQCYLQTTTHGRRYVTLNDCGHTQFAFYAPRPWMQVPPNWERTQRFQSQAYCSRAMWPCCDFTSSDDDEHNTDNNLLLLFADVDITLTLLEGLTEVDVLLIALGCRFALDVSHDFAATSLCT